MEQPRSRKSTALYTGGAGGHHRNAVTSRDDGVGVGVWEREAFKVTPGTSRREARVKKLKKIKKKTLYWAADVLAFTLIKRRQPATPKTHTAGQNNSQCSKNKKHTIKNKSVLFWNPTGSAKLVQTGLNGRGSAMTTDVGAFCSELLLFRCWQFFTATKWHKSLPLPDAFRSVMAGSAGDVLGRELWRRQWTGKRTHSGTLPSVGHSCFGSTRDLTRQLPLCCKIKKI